MASRIISAPKRVNTAVTTKTTMQAVAKRNGSTENGSTQSSLPRRKPKREMTLEELSLRAYKMTYDQVHGSKKKQQ